MKQKVSNLFIVIIFIAMITVPQIVWWIIGGGSESVAATENRNLSSKPELKLSSITSYPKSFDSYYNDNLPFRNKLIKTWANINYDIFGTTIDSRVVIGKEGWLFYRGDSSIQQVQGISTYSEKQKEIILASLKFNKDKLAERGIEYYVLVIPNKENIYREYLPDTISIKEAVSRTEKLIDYIKENSDVNIIYPKKELIGEKGMYQVYRKCDTHWNDIGALVGTVTLQKAIEPNFSYDLNDIEVEKTNTINGDLSRFASLEKEFYEDEIKVNNFYQEIAYEEEQLVNDAEKDYEDETFIEMIKENFLKLYEEITNNRDKYSEDLIKDIEKIYTINNLEKFTSNSMNNKKVLFIGDSFRNAMKAHFSKLYGEVIYIHKDNYRQELLEEIEPDIVVYEVVERYSDSLAQILIEE